MIVPEQALPPPHIVRALEHPVVQIAVPILVTCVTVYVLHKFGLVSTARLVVGVAAAGSGRPEILIAGLAGLVAGAMSMAAGEYVSVSSQTDAEQADIARETKELAETPEEELNELTSIYLARGLDEALARQVAEKLTANDALGAHARDELGISETVVAHPIQAALVSAATFSIGAVVPLVVAAMPPTAQRRANGDEWVGLQLRLPTLTPGSVGIECPATASCGVSDLTRPLIRRLWIHLRIAGASCYRLSSPMRCPTICCSPVTFT